MIKGSYLVLIVAALVGLASPRALTQPADGIPGVLAPGAVPELVQDNFTAEAVAREAVSMLTDRERTARIREGLATVRARLGGPGASRRAAEAIMRIVKQPTQAG